MNKETKTFNHNHPPYTAFKRAIAGKGLTLRDVAATIGVTESTLSQKINGSSDFFVTEIEAICKTFELNVAIFFVNYVA